jgi:hypothetical protein
MLDHGQLEPATPISPLSQPPSKILPSSVPPKLASCEPSSTRPEPAGIGGGPIMGGTLQISESQGGGRAEEPSYALGKRLSDAVASPSLPSASTESAHSHAAASFGEKDELVAQLYDPAKSRGGGEVVLANAKCSGYFLEPVS